MFGGGSTIAIIAGSVGGAIFFIIISLLCIVIFCVKQSQKRRRSHSFDNKMVIEMNPDVKMNNNPSYNIITQNRKQEDQYDYAVHNKSHVQDNTKDTMKIDSNPSYGRVQGVNTVGTKPVYDVDLETNPCYNLCIQMTEDEDENGYVETNPPSIQGANYLKVYI